MTYEEAKNMFLYSESKGCPLSLVDYWDYIKDLKQGGNTWIINQ